jgi:heme exporter protein A
MTDTEEIVVLVGIAADVERVPVLRDLDFRVVSGESVGLVGANGSGKSTLLRVLATLLAPAGGEGRVLGAVLGTVESAAVRPSIALVGHEAALYPRLTLLENLSFLARLVGREEREARAALDAVGLARAADRRTEACSQGMRRRAELARVLLTEPRLLLLDEAHAGLDMASTGLVEAVVERVCRRGGASVVVAHDHTWLRGVADRVVEVAGGRAISQCDEERTTVWRVP